MREENLKERNRRKISKEIIEKVEGEEREEKTQNNDRWKEKQRKEEERGGGLFWINWHREGDLHIISFNTNQMTLK